jgi:hypothetical protein
MGVTDIGTEGAFYDFQIRLVAVAGKLDAIGEPGRKVVHEDHCGIAIAASNEP